MTVSYPEDDYPLTDETFPHHPTFQLGGAPREQRRIMEGITGFYYLSGLITSRSEICEADKKNLSESLKIVNEAHF